MSTLRRVKLPEPVAEIYRATAKLEEMYPGRRFTPDGHLVGSIGEVIAAEALGLTLYAMSQPGHDAYDANGNVQIKMTAGKSVAMYATCERLVVLRVVSPQEAEIVYDGPGAPAWEQAGKMGKNGQRVISLVRLGGLAKAPGGLEEVSSPSQSNQRNSIRRRPEPLLEIYVKEISWPEIYIYPNEGKHPGLPHVTARLADGDVNITIEKNPRALTPTEGIRKVPKALKVISENRKMLRRVWDQSRPDTQKLPKRESRDTTRKKVK